MKKLLTALLASLVLLGLSAPAWAHESSNKEQMCPAKKDRPRGPQDPKVDKHELKVLNQLKVLKKAYARATEDARQMFLEFLGSSPPSADTEIQKIRDEYEQQISQLNATMASCEQQVAQLSETVASQQQQLTDLNKTIDSKQQQIDSLVESHQTELDNLSFEMAQQCQGRVDAAYNDGQAAGMESCANNGPAGGPQPVRTWNTGGHYPYALDVDVSGNTYILDKSYPSTVAGYNSTGFLITDWTSNTLVSPVDIAADSHGDIYILDQSAEHHLQKFTPDGQQITFDTSPTDLNYPLGLFIDSQDNIYVTDMGGDYGGRILKFGPSGALVDTIGVVNDPDLIGQEYCDIAVDETSNTIYIVTRYNHMVAKFKTDGTYQVWQGDLDRPNSIAIGAQGQVFVADTYNSQIDLYDADGNLMYSIISDDLYMPNRIVVDNSGKLHVAVENYQLIQAYQ